MALRFAVPFSFAIACSAMSAALAGSIPVVQVAQNGPSPAPDYFHVTPADLKWVDNPAVPCAKFAYIFGDPKKPGAYVYRVRFAPNCVVPAHTHPDDRLITVLSGTVYHGEGRKLDEAKRMKYPTGSMFSDGRAPHFGGSRDEETVIEVHGTGPSGIAYIDPADDPRKK